MTPTRDEYDAKIAASEARSETKIARVEGKLDMVVKSISDLSVKMDTIRSDNSSNRNVVIGTVVGAALAIIGSVIAVMAYGTSAFYNGTIIRDVIHNEVTSATKQPAAAITPSTGTTQGR